MLEDYPIEYDCDARVIAGSRDIMSVRRVVKLGIEASEVSYLQRGGGGYDVRSKALPARGAGTFVVLAALLGLASSMSLWGFGPPSCLPCGNIAMAMPLWLWDGDGRAWLL